MRNNTKFNKPEDFEQIYSKLKSVNATRLHYNIATPAVIHKWLKESNIDRQISNTKKENIIDLEKFKQDVLNNKLSKQQIASKHNISVTNIREICKRNNISIIHLKNNKQLKQFVPNDKQQFLDFLIKNGKQKTAHLYNVPLHTIVNYCNQNNIVVESYKGLKKDVSINNQFIHDCKTMESHNQICKKYNITSLTLKRLVKEHEINLIPNQFQVWEKNNEIIKQNMNMYIEQNKQGKTLLEIATEANIAVEVLKKQFRLSKTPVVLHSYNKSKGELQLKQFIIGCGFNCVSQKIKYNNICYELDCYVKEKNFAVEYCGEFWHSLENKHKNYHYDKYVWCKQQNIELYTLFEHEWLYKRQIVESMIKNKLGITKNKIFARDLQIVEITSQKAKTFCDQNHIHGGVYGKINYALVKNGELYCVIVVSQTRFNVKEEQCEIIRFCSLLDTNVVGGFSKLLKRVLEKCKTDILSFANLRFGEGKVYSKAGFEYHGITVPNYWYYPRSGNDVFHSRIKFQKHKLHKILDNFNPDLTEYQNMLNNGWMRIYDCGNNKYIYRNTAV